MIVSPSSFSGVRSGCAFVTAATLFIVILFSPLHAEAEFVVNDTRNCAERLDDGLAVASAEAWGGAVGFVGGLLLEWLGSDIRGQLTLPMTVTGLWIGNRLAATRIQAEREAAGHLAIIADRLGWVGDLVPISPIFIGVVNEMFTGLPASSGPDIVAYIAAAHGMHQYRAWRHRRRWRRTRSEARHPTSR